jgi:hypothetical protein
MKRPGIGSNSRCDVGDCNRLISDDVGDAQPCHRGDGLGVQKAAEQIYELLADGRGIGLAR